MRFLLAGIVALAAMAIAVPPSPAQTPPPQTPQQPSRQTNGKVIFSRSTDENGQTTTQVAPAATQPEIKTATAPSAADSDRQAITFTDFDMDVRLRSAEQLIAVRALVTVSNDGKTPLARIPLQISASLAWERIRLNGKDVALAVATLNSDADHTGQLHEVAVPLTQPLAPGQSLQLDVTYSGAIAASAQRLLSIGTPEDVALHSDWDQIGLDFTGLRGFGNVVWYPVSSVPVILGDGARLFDEMGEHKLRLSGAHFRLRLTVEFPHGHAPTVALINGHPAPLTVTEADNSDGRDVASVAIADPGQSTLGFEAPSLFVAIRTPHSGANTTLWTRAEDDPAAQSWIAAATTVTPFLQGWLGQKPRSQLIILDLPDPADAPYETGAMLATAIRTPGPEANPEATAAQLDGILAHALTHAWMQSPRPWLSEGVAHFMGTLWTEKQYGRQQALETLESARSALALAEPDSPGQSAGQPLAEAISPVYYRTKAAYVFWMLRDVAGDQALSAALRAYNPTDDASKAYGKDAEPGSFERLLEKSSPRNDLKWFFDDWVNADKGLPDLSIESVFSSLAEAGNWLVAVSVVNNGYAAAEVPITVSSSDKSVTQHVLIPARGKAVQRILILGKPTEVEINDGTIPETQATIHIKKLDQPEADSSSSSQPAPQPEAPR